MAIWGANRRGDYYCVDYTVGSDPVMLHEKLHIKNVESIEGHVNSMLAEKHSVPLSQIGSHQIVRVNE